MTQTKARLNVRRNLFILTLSALFLALGVLLPQAFHLVLGQQGGQILLPMHIPVLLAGCFLGWQYGLFVGAFTPLLSFFLTQMPPVPNVFLMMAELAFYGFAGGLFNKLMRSREKGGLPRVALAVLLAQLAGRAAYALALLLLGNLLGLKGVSGAEIVLAAALKGLPGIAVQLVFVPLLVRGLHRLKVGAEML
ncbi:MAG: ECF transporter S component [Oscillospiraceae bacterium]|jgi:niacin transporter|nr:ECF transporter S component [Oscillospiraceae bacterium]